MVIFEGQQFKLKETGEVIILVSIQERDSRKAKLPDPILTFKYYSLRPNFTTYKSHVEQHINFGSWIKTRI
jgi:hypothetical protein